MLVHIYYPTISYQHESNLFWMLIRKICHRGHHLAQTFHSARQAPHTLWNVCLPNDNFSVFFQLIPKNGLWLRNSYPNTLPKGIFATSIKKIRAKDFKNIDFCNILKFYRKSEKPKLWNNLNFSFQLFYYIYWFIRIYILIIWYLLGSKTIRNA